MPAAWSKITSRCFTRPPPNVPGNSRQVITRLRASWRAGFCSTGDARHFPFGALRRHVDDEALLEAGKVGAHEVDHAVDALAALEVGARDLARAERSQVRGVLLAVDQRHAAFADHGGDLIYVQGHVAPGIYARAFLEGRISEEQMLNFRQEVGGKGLSSYPHPKLMPEFWQFPTVSMGLGPLMAIYQARFLKYLHARGIANTENRKVWVFCGDGEMDEPESLGAIGLAAREKLDNLIFVINCNLQRLDGPVRGNGKIIQELEGEFRGAGWNVIKLIWGKEWDSLLARDFELAWTPDVGAAPATALFTETKGGRTYALLMAAPSTRYPEWEPFLAGVLATDDDAATSAAFVRLLALLVCPVCKGSVEVEPPGSDGTSCFGGVTRPSRIGTSAPFASASVT